MSHPDPHRPPQQQREARHQGQTIVRRTGPIMQHQQQQHQHHQYQQQEPQQLVQGQMMDNLQRQQQYHQQPQQYVAAPQQQQQPQQNSQQQDDALMLHLADRLLSSAGGQAKLREALGLGHQQQVPAQQQQPMVMRNTGSSSRGGSVMTIPPSGHSNAQQNQQQLQQHQQLVSQLKNQHQVDSETIRQLEVSQKDLNQRLLALDGEWKQKFSTLQRQATDSEASLRAENSKLKTQLRNAQDHDSQREQLFQLEREQLKGKLRQQLQEAQNLTQAQIDNALKMERANQAFVAGQQMEELRKSLATVEAENRSLRLQIERRDRQVDGYYTASTVGVKQEEAGAVDRFASAYSAASGTNTEEQGGLQSKKRRTEDIGRGATLPSALKKPEVTTTGPTVLTGGRPSGVTPGQDLFPTTTSNPIQGPISAAAGGRSISAGDKVNTGTSPLEKRLPLFQSNSSPQLAAELAASSRRAIAAKNKKHQYSRSGAPAQQQESGSNNNQEAVTPGTAMTSIGFNSNSITMLSGGGAKQQQRSFTLMPRGQGEAEGGKKLPRPETTSSQPSPVPHNPLRGPDMERRFVFSGVDAISREKLTTQVEALGQRASLIDCPQDAPPPKRTTHIVIEDRPRNVKALCGVVGGMFVVTKEYITESAAKGFWLDELDFGAVRFFPPPLRDKQVVVRVPDDAIRERIEDVVRFGEGIVVDELAGEQVDSTMLILHSGDALLEFCNESVVE